MINEVLKGITDALYAAFGDKYEIHTEASMQDMEEPAFFVRCINPDVPRGLTGRRKATLLFIVQYFPESDEPKKEIKAAAAPPNLSAKRWTPANCRNAEA